MLFLLLSSISFLLLLSRTIPLKPLQLWPAEKKLRWLKSCRLITSQLFKVPPTMPARDKCAAGPAIGESAVAAEMTILDLPDLALDCILRRLSPAGLCSMTCVNRSLRDRCRSDYLWEPHMRGKWGRVIGPAARREWEQCVASRRDFGSVNGVRPKGYSILGSLSCWLPISWFNSRLLDVGGKPRSSLPADDSMMAWYLALESGRYWFPAQVYNRQNGHVGFMLSCYDAELNYDRLTDTFDARYPPHGRRPINTEKGVQWDKLRAPPVDTPSHDLHVSDCLNKLYPGNHIEIQWRKNKEFPYGWWYGVVGHLESCDGREHRCHCHDNDTVMLEFNHYTPGSRWRRKVINRKNHREDGDETDGFYGGIRKLLRKDEISTWRRLWPSEVLE